MAQNDNRQDKQNQQPDGADILRDIGSGIEKIIKAGIGAVKSGVECSQETIDKWAEKGEPAFQNAKSALNNAAGKLKKAVDESPIPDNLSMMLGGKVTLDTLKNVLRRLTKQELDAVREMIDGLYRDAKDQTEATADADTVAPNETAQVHPAAEETDAPADASESDAEDE